MASGSAPPPPIADLSAFERQKEQKAWYFYDWANSAYVTTIATVLFAPYLIAVAETAACGEAGTDDNPCNVDLSVLGVQRLPRLAGLLCRDPATVLSAFVLPVVGAIADRSATKKNLMAGFAWTGSAFAAAMFLVTGSNWQLGAVLILCANSASAPAWSSTTRSCARSRPRTSAIESHREAGPWATSVAGSCSRSTLSW